MTCRVQLGPVEACSESCLNSFVPCHASPSNAGSSRSSRGPVLPGLESCLILLFPCLVESRPDWLCLATLCRASPFLAPHHRVQPGPGPPWLKIFWFLALLCPGKTCTVLTSQATPGFASPHLVKPRQVRSLNSLGSLLCLDRRSQAASRSAKPRQAMSFKSFGSLPSRVTHNRVMPNIAIPRPVGSRLARL